MATYRIKWTTPGYHTGGLTEQTVQDYATIEEMRKVYRRLYAGAMCYHVVDGRERAMTVREVTGTMDTATYRIQYTDRFGNTCRSWTVNAASAVDAVRAGFASESLNKFEAASMYGRSGVVHSNETYGLLMTDGRESCSVVRQD